MRKKKHNACLFNIVVVDAHQIIQYNVSVLDSREGINAFLKKMVATLLLIC